MIESAHLLALALLGGAVLLVDLRLLGFGLRGQSTASLSRQVRPWLLLGIAGLIVTGIPLFLSEAVKCYYNTSFWVKMTTLPIVLVYTFAVRDRIARVEALDLTTRARLAGAASLALWFTVAAAGRWIGYS